MSTINEVLGRVISRMSRVNIKSYFPPDTVRSLGGKYWKLMTVAQKRSYLETTGLVIQDDLTADHHIGDADFQSAILGHTDRFINIVGDTVTDNYLESSKDKNTFNFPQKLKNIIYSSTSDYSFSKLLKTQASYVEKNIERITPVPEHSLARDVTFSHWDMIWKGIRIISALPPDEQQDCILVGLAPDANSGYPYVSRTTKKSFGKMFKNFVEQYFPRVLSNHKENVSEGIYLTVDMILDTVRAAIEEDYFPPFIGFYRVQEGEKESKVRGVFGGDVLMKALGAMWSAAKGFKDEEYVKFGGLSWIAWDEWTILFDRIKYMLPDIIDGQIVPESKESLADKHGERAELLPDGEHIIDCYGEDFVGYDQCIIREDIEWITKHKHVGWIMKWILDCLSYSEVWIGGKRLIGLFYKSGHPFTSVIGSAFHLQISCSAADAMGAILLSSTVLSDDNLSFWYNFDERTYIKYCYDLGLTIDPSKSSWFSRDKIVRFLGVYVGYIFDTSYISYVGDPQTRYYGIAHSEREYKGQFGTEQMRGDLRQLWKVTGDVEIDALLSKLGSFAMEGTTWVLSVLDAVKHTDLGSKAIHAIVRLGDMSEDIVPYRTDMFISFSPTWLGKLNVQDLLLDRPLR